jgi:predicted  nucleic acid-binding Zn-ribbon protein
MAIIAKMAPFWKCDVCGDEWALASERMPRQCHSCGSRRWNDGIVGEADQLLRSLVVRHLNPYRRLLSVRQKAGLMRIAANRRAESARKAAQSSL